MTDAVIGLPLCTLYVEAREGSEVADEVLHGMSVTVLGSEEEWLHLRTSYRYEGFARREAVLKPSPDGWAERARSVVIAPFADVMDGPAYRNTIVTTLPRGALLLPRAAVEADGQWSPVTLADGREGFVRSTSLRPLRIWNEVDEEGTRERLVEDALLYRGSQYRWGGKTPQGIDCSGLCSMAYLLNGLAIYRDAAIREDFPVRPVAAEKARRGDLIFWPGHVGLYLGEGRYVHSTGFSGAVVENSLLPGDGYRDDLARSVSAWGSVF